MDHLTKGIFAGVVGVTVFYYYWMYMEAFTDDSDSTVTVNRGEEEGEGVEIVDMGGSGEDRGVEE